MRITLRGSPAREGNESFFTTRAREHELLSREQSSWVVQLSNERLSDHWAKSLRAMSRGDWCRFTCAAKKSQQWLQVLHVPLGDLSPPTTPTRATPWSHTHPSPLLPSHHMSSLPSPHHHLTPTELLAFPSNTLSSFTLTSRLLLSSSPLVRIALSPSHLLIYPFFVYHRCSRSPSARTPTVLTLTPSSVFPVLATTPPPPLHMLLLSRTAILLASLFCLLAPLTEHHVK